ncbi:MAG: hypothetical protein MUF22_03430 [Chitinispirillaceae bacterium]|jgi:hypothetical protein|nr:hypothetical protein [Chitinispirillaceae bacterium]
MNIERTAPAALLASFMLLLSVNMTSAAVPASPDSTARQEYSIDQPGTITFRVGMVIKGKIEKPQVVIFLPKEKPYFREFKVTHSFVDDLNDPLPFVPIVD